jgi:hypothetical protein
MGDFLVDEPIVPFSDYLAYANNEWKFSLTREEIDNAGAFGKSYQIDVTVDLSAQPVIIDMGGLAREYVPAQIKGVISWYYLPTYGCPGITKNIDYSTTGYFRLAKSEDGYLTNYGDLQIFNTLVSIPSFFSLPPIKVNCQAYDNFMHEYHHWTEERMPRYWINPFVIIRLQPGNRIKTDAMIESKSRRTWTVRIEPVGPLIPCLNKCDDNNACTIDNCKMGVGCIQTPLSCSTVNKCFSASCDPAIGCIYKPLTGIFNLNPHDCYKNECQNGYRIDIPDDFEVPSQASPHVSCEKQVCVGGDVQTIADITEIPPQALHNCRREVCGPYGVEYREDNTDEPFQESHHDCLRQVCQRGEIISVPDDSETPLPSYDGRPRVCRGGESVLATE